MNDLIININGEDHNISVDTKNIYYNGNEQYTADITELNSHAFLIKLEDKVYEVTTYKTNEDELLFTLDGYTYNVNIKTRLDKIAGELYNSSKSNTDEYLIKAPMPGMIVKIYAEKGSTIEKGSPLLTLEAMKMENVIKSDYNGVVEEVNCKEGQSVDKNNILIKVKIES